MKIYWDKKLQQIRTKGGECLFDKNGFANEIMAADKRVNAHFELNEKKLAAFRQELNTWQSHFQKQLQCAAKTQGKHKMMFVKKGSEETATHQVNNAPSLWFVTYSCGTSDRDFVFKCSVCGLEIAKTEKELSAAEKEALKKLKLL